MYTKMKSGLKDYVCEWEQYLNKPLMTKSADRPLVDYVIDAWKSLEVVPNIKFTRFEYTEKESEIDVNKHIFKREKKKKKKDRVDVKFIDDSRVGKLTVYFDVTMKETNPTTGETTYQVYPIKKTMLIPLQDDDGYYTIKGKKYYLLYQLLEKSTYTSNSSVTLKSLMPIALKRIPIEGVDVNGVVHNLPSYYVFVFRKEIPVILFYLSKGVDYALDYLGVSEVVSFSETLPPGDVLEKNVTFQLSNKCYLLLDKEMFYKHPFIQSMAGMFMTVCTNRVTIEQLRDPKPWIKKISNPNNYEKGYSILKYFNRLMDNVICSFKTSLIAGNSLEPNVP